MYRIAVLLILLIGCEKEENPIAQSIDPVPVLIVTPTLEDVSLELETIGTLRAIGKVPIYSEVEGRLQEVLVQEGEWVHEGTPLFKIDPQSYLLKMEEAKAQIAIDEAILAAAERKLARFNRLLDRSIVAESEWDKYQTEVIKARNVVNLDLVRLEMIALDLKRCLIVSPIEGRVGKLEAFTGHLVSANDNEPLAMILQMDPLLVEFTLTEQEFEKFQTGSHAFSAYPLHKLEASFKGKITFIDNDFDPKTGQILVRGKIANPNVILRPGQLVHLKIPFEKKENVLLLPQKSIKYNMKGPYVYIIGEDKIAEQKPVTLGETFEKDIIIYKGITQHDKVITEGHLRLFPGAKVEAL